MWTHKWYPQVDWQVQWFRKLADKYNGSVSQRDVNIKSLKFSICVDLSRHLDPAKVQKLRKVNNKTQRIERGRVEVNFG
jgi:hypothetical protein